MFPQLQLRNSGLLLLTACVVSASNPALAQEKKEKPRAVLSESEVDADYWIQGEYMGQVLEEAHSPVTKKIGVQVVARGKGHFDVMLLEGGLPGDGWNQQDRSKFTGTSEGQQLRVQAGEYHLTIGGNQVHVQDGQGRQLGTLPKLARQSATLGLRAPEGAIVLFDGKTNDLWKNMKVTSDGLLQEGCETVGTYGDFRLHLEFQLPYKPEGVGQDRGNSGLYLQRRYEIQMLDSFGEPELPNHCGSVYTIVPPDQNMTLTPLAWQTYDVEFRAARFDDEGNKTENMKIRVLHNGVVIHDGIEVERKTGAGRPEGPEKLPILLQDHGNPVRYRNVWLVEEDPFDPETKKKRELAEQNQSSDACEGDEFVSGGRRYRRGAPEGGTRWPDLYRYDFQTPYHNYGYNPYQPLPYWYSPSYVDLPAYPYYGFKR